MKQIFRKEEKVILERCGVSQGFTYVVCGQLVEKVWEDSYSVKKGCLKDTNKTKKQRCLKDTVWNSWQTIPDFCMKRGQFV